MKKKKKRIILAKISKLEENILLMNIVAGEIPSWLKIGLEFIKEEPEPSPPILEGTIQDITNEKWISQEVKKMLAEIDNYISVLKLSKKKVYKNRTRMI